MVIPIKFDLHIHSKYSSDSRSTLDTIIKSAKKVGLDGIAVTDHNSIDSWRYLKNKKSSSLILVPGIEISTDHGHIIALGVEEKVSPGKLDETILSVEDKGGIVIAAHPYRFWSGIGEKAVKENRWSALEGLNGRSGYLGNKRACKLADKMRLPVVGGSDSHRADTVGKSYTIVEAVSGWEDLMDEIKKGRTSVGGENRSLNETFRYVGRSVSNWAKRGFKRI